jgi:hypothetical protein
LAQAMQTAAIEAEEEKQKLKKKVKGAQNSAIFLDFAVFFVDFYVDIIGDIAEYHDCSLFYGTLWDFKSV